MLAVNLQRLLVAGHIAYHRIVVDAGEDRCRRTQCQAAKLAMLYLEDKGGRGFALGIRRGGYAPELRQRA